MFCGQRGYRNCSIEFSPRYIYIYMWNHLSFACRYIPTFLRTTIQYSSTGMSGICKELCATLRISPYGYMRSYTMDVLLHHTKLKFLRLQVGRVSTYLGIPMYAYFTFSSSAGCMMCLSCCFGYSAVVFYNIVTGVIVVVSPFRCCSIVICSKRPLIIPDRCYRLPD